MLGEAFREAMSIDGWVLLEVLARNNGGERAWAAIACPLLPDGKWLHRKARNGFGRTPTDALRDLVQAVRAYEARP